MSIKWFNKLIDENEQDNDDKYISCVLERMEAVIATTKSKHPNTKSVYDELDIMLNHIKYSGGKILKRRMKHWGDG